MSDSPPTAPHWRLRVWTRFLAPVDQVWALKTDPERISDEFRPLRFVVDDAAGLRAALASGGEGEFHARLWPLGLSWPIRLSEVEPGRSFVDRSQNALFQTFEHRHLVEATQDGARYVDDLLLCPTAPGAAMKVELVRRLFERRHRRAARHLPHDPRATAIVVLREVLEHELAPA